MGTGTKVAIGCGCVVLLGGAVLIGALGWGAWWARGKVRQVSAGIDTMTATANEIERYEKQANANPYTAPADGVIAEPRLVKFLEVRKQVYAVYGRYESELASISKKADSSGDKLTLSQLWSAGGSLAEMAAAIRLAQMKALAAIGMSESEYRDIQLAVYKSAWASESETKSGKLPAEAVSQAMSEAGQQMGGAMRSGIEEARKQGVPGSEHVSEEDARKLQEGMKQLGHDAGEALHVPRANVELFRRHQLEIKKYAMNGLAFLGL
jgi:hypothetical protein